MPPLRTNGEHFLSKIGSHFVNLFPCTVLLIQVDRKHKSATTFRLKKNCEFLEGGKKSEVDSANASGTQGTDTPRVYLKKNQQESQVGKKKYKTQNIPGKEGTRMISLDCTKNPPILRDDFWATRTGTISSFKAKLRRNLFKKKKP